MNQLWLRNVLRPPAEQLWYKILPGERRSLGRQTELGKTYIESARGVTESALTPPPAGLLTGYEVDLSYSLMKHLLN